MLAEIITIGDEILIGQIIDSNSAWIAQQLNKIGVRVKQISSVSDDREHILKGLTEAAQRADIILITGGLGPTKDDITKKTLANYFGVGLIENKAALDNVTDIFKRFNRPMLETNKQQAWVPQNCEVLLNKNGTAPGMWFNEAGKIYVSMPGVPYEMMYMMEEDVLPRINQSFNLPAILHKTILTVGEGESFLAETIADIEDSLPPHIKLAYLPKIGQVRLRLSGYTSGSADELLNEIDIYAQKIIDRVPHAVAATEDIPLEKAILNTMAQKGFTLSVAESCTGGFISSLFTQHPGSSKVFLGGAVTYDNSLKINVLDVSEDTLQQYGAVSSQTVTEMLKGALKNLGGDYTVAVSGIAGPDGGTPDKPVGTVWIGVASAENSIVKSFLFRGKRAQIIERSAITALGLLNTLLKQ